MSPKVKKKFRRSWVVAFCNDCSWESRDKPNTQALAANHAKYHKHYVTVLIEITGYYDGKTKPTETEE